MEIAEEEIERTSQEAVKAALVEVGGELAYEQERARQLEQTNFELKKVNEELGIRNEELVKKRSNMLLGGLIVGGTMGVVVSCVAFGLTGGFIR